MIGIAMTTYNGEKYLKEQIDSILNQTVSDFELIVCDDVSSDSTMDILNDYAEKDDRVHVFRNEENLGFLKNFEKAIRICLDRGAEYVALSDQDDVWMPTKIDDTLHRMKDAERECARDIPLLVFTDLVVVDNSLQEVSPSFWKQNRFCVDVCCKFPYICVANCVAGCTMMINAPARSLVLPFSINVPPMIICWT